MPTLDLLRFIPMTVSAENKTTNLVHIQRGSANVVSAVLLLKNGRLARIYKRRGCFIELACTWGTEYL